MAVILHVDMDAFYASVEAERRDLKNQPIVICVYSGRSKDSGAVSTCSYEARELGIHAAMPIKHAKKIANNTEQKVHFIGMDKDYYDQFSDDIREKILEQYTQTIEKASIDEFYLKIDTDNFEKAEKIAGEIREQVKNDFGVTCSVGVAPNKLVAKIASDQEKPEGLTVVTPDEIESFMHNLEIEEIYGIGDKTREKLADLGIKSVKDLSESNPSLLIREFGETQGIKLRQKAQGKDDSEVKDSMQSQITRINTLEQNSRSFNNVRKVFPELASDIVEKLDEKDADFGSVTLIAIDTTIEMHTRSTSLKTRVRDEDIIVEEGEQLLENFMQEFEGMIRRVGLRVSDLKKRKGQKSFTDFS